MAIYFETIWKARKRQRPPRENKLSSLESSLSSFNKWGLKMKTKARIKLCASSFNSKNWYTKSDYKAYRKRQTTKSEWSKKWMFFLRDLSKFTQLYLHLIFDSNKAARKHIKIKNWMRIVLVLLCKDDDEERFVKKILWKRSHLKH